MPHGRPVHVLHASSRAHSDREQATRAPAAHNGSAHVSHSLARLPHAHTIHAVASSSDPSEASARTACCSRRARHAPSAHTRQLHPQRLHPQQQAASAASRRPRSRFRPAFFASPIVFPMVARGKARVRVIVSASFSQEDCDAGLAAFKRVAEALATK